MFLAQFHKKSRFIVYLPAIFWAGLIFVLSSQPVLPSPSVFLWDFAFKKTAHMFVYFVLYRLVYNAVSFEVKNPLKASLITFILCALYACSDEFHQSFVSGRTPSTKDVLFDMLGMGIAWLSVFRYI